MTRNAILTALAFGLAISFCAGTADAESKQRKRVAKPAVAAASISNRQSAHMIEVRPGLWISSYGCVTDEGYGRYTSCDTTDSGGR